MPPVLLAADVLTSETLVPVGSAVAVLLMAIGGARGYEALRGTQNTQREDLTAVVTRVDGLAKDMKADRERSDKRHEDLVHRVAITESREAVADQKLVNVESHLRAQDVKLDKIDDKIDRFDDKLDRALMHREHHRRKDDAA